MVGKNYADFDLLIERTGKKYRARVLNSPAGPATHDFTLPFSDEKLENFILRISQGRRTMRTIKPVEVDASREFGDVLFKAVFAGTVADCWRNSLATLDPNQQSLRLRLRLSDAPELVDIPWEYLYDSTNRRFLALSVDTPLVRYLDISGRITPLAVKPPLNVLVMISSPIDVVQLDVEQEWERLKSALADLEQQGQIRLYRLEKATLDGLQKHLRRHDYHIFHYIGHGGFDPKTNDGVLMLEDENGRGKEVSGQTLGTLLHDEKTLRLALLNACEGGRTSKTDPFAGVGQSLLQQGVPAVIAMQFEVTDDTAITLAHSFYSALADGYPVDAALTEARKTIFARNPLEWGTPVLYMRAPDGRVFDVAGVDPATKTQNQIATLLAAGQTALLTKEWGKTEELFKQVIALDPANSAAASGLASARQGLAEAKITPSPSVNPLPISPTVATSGRSKSGLFLGIGGGLVALLIGWLVWRNISSGREIAASATATSEMNTVVTIASEKATSRAQDIQDPVILSTSRISVDSTSLILPTSVLTTGFPTKAALTVPTSASAIPTVITQPSTLTPKTLANVSTPTATLLETVTATQTIVVSTPLPPTPVAADTVTQPTTIAVATPTLLSSNTATPTLINQSPEATANAFILVVDLTDCSTMLPNGKIWKGELQAQCDPAVMHDGYYALWLNTLDTWAVVERYSSLISVEPNQQYEVSYWVKTDLVYQLADMYGKVITSEYYSVAREEDAVNENRNGTGFSTGRSIGGTTDWAYQSYQFTTRADATFIRLRAVMGGPDQTGGAKGSMWITQLNLRKIVNNPP